RPAIVANIRSANMRLRSECRALAKRLQRRTEELPQIVIGVLVRLVRPSQVRQNAPGDLPPQFACARIVVGTTLSWSASLRIVNPSGPAESHSLTPPTRAEARRRACPRGGGG